MNRCYQQHSFERKKLFSSETWKQPSSTMTSHLMEECSIHTRESSLLLNDRSLRFVLPPCFKTDTDIVHKHDYANKSMWVQTSYSLTTKRIKSQTNWRYHMSHKLQFYRFDVLAVATKATLLSGMFTGVTARRPQLVLGWVITRDDDWALWTLGLFVGVVCDWPSI